MISVCGVRAADKPQQGFTLLEVLVAISITAIIGLAVWQVTSSVIQARDRVDALASDFGQLQRAIVLLERDLTQAINRPVRTPDGGYEPALDFAGPGAALQVTRQGWRNPLGLRRSRLQRVGWQYRDGDIHRFSWPVLDRVSEEGLQDVRLLGDIRAFRLRFMDHQGQWHGQWPVADMAQATGAPGTRVPLPRAVEIVLEHQQFGALERLFVLPDYEPADAAGDNPDSPVGDVLADGGQS